MLASVCTYMGLLLIRRDSCRQYQFSIPTQPNDRWITTAKGLSPESRMRPVAGTCDRTQDALLRYLSRRLDLGRRCCKNQEMSFPPGWYTQSIDRSLRSSKRYPDLAGLP